MTKLRQTTQKRQSIPKPVSRSCVGKMLGPIAGLCPGALSHNPPSLSPTPGWMDVSAMETVKCPLLTDELWGWLGLSSIKSAEQDVKNAITLINELLKKPELKFWLKLDWCSSEVGSNLLFLICLTTPTSRKRDEESEEAKESELTGAECEETLKHFKWKVRQKSLSVNYRQD